MFHNVSISWNFNLPFATPSLILETNLMSHFWDSECVTPLSSLGHLLLLIDLASLPLGAHLETPGSLTPSPLLASGFGCHRYLVSDLDLASLRFLGCSSVHPMTLLLPFLPQVGQWPLSLLDGPSPFWNFLVGRLSYTYSPFDIKQHCSAFNSNWILCAAVKLALFT